MQLVEKGRLDLDAPVQKYVPSFPTKKFPITTRQLLAHFEEASAILKASKSQLLRVQGIGQETAEAIAGWESRVDLPGELKRNRNGELAELGLLRLFDHNLSLHAVTDGDMGLEGLLNTLFE